MSDTHEAFSLSTGASAKYSVLYLLGLALPYVHFMFLIWVVFEIFTPIMGRSGTEIPPEVVLASLVTLATIFLSSFFVSIPASCTTNIDFTCQENQI